MGHKTNVWVTCPILRNHVIMSYEESFYDLERLRPEEKIVINYVIPKSTLVHTMDYHKSFRVLKQDI